MGEVRKLRRIYLPSGKVHMWRLKRNWLVDIQNTNGVDLPKRHLEEDGSIPLVTRSKARLGKRPIVRPIWRMARTKISEK